VWNREKYLATTLRSVLSQAFSSLEIIVVDDASTDGTDELARRISLSEARLKVVRHRTQAGAQAARNTGIAQSRGEWITFLDSDDEWLPHSLAARLEAARLNSADVVYSDCLLRRTPGGDLRPMGIFSASGSIYDRVLVEPGPMYQSLLVRRRCFDQIGALDTAIVSHQEWDTSIRLAEYYSFAYCSSPTFIYNCYTSNAISTNFKRTAKGYWQVTYKHHDQIQDRLGKRCFARQMLRAAKLYSKAGEKSTALSLIARSLILCPSIFLDGFGPISDA